MSKPVATLPVEQTDPNEFQEPYMTPNNLAVKCPACKELLLTREWERNQKVCLHCSYHFRLTAWERIELLVDCQSFREIDAAMVSVDPLNFIKQTSDETLAYTDALRTERCKTGLHSAVVSGYARIDGLPLALAVMDFCFLGACMDSVTGEKIARTIELGIKRGHPVLIVTASGGPQVHEGAFALMQMARTSAALAKLAEARLPYIALLTDPTTGSVASSFAMLGDITLAEPGALIGIAGPRSLLQTRLPESKVRAELLLQRGMIDAIVPRRELRATLIRLLHMYKPCARPWARAHHSPPYTG